MGFLPYPDSTETERFFMTALPLQPPAALRALVTLGAAAVPALLECLADSRPTAIKPLEPVGSGGRSDPDTYDYNRRTEPPPPTSVNLRADISGPAHPYQVVVGDLCFVALGQILNRSFVPAGYQVFGQLDVSSPARLSALREVVRERLAGFTVESHRASLVRDLLQPDFSLAPFWVDPLGRFRHYVPARREGAALRLSFYYPTALQQVVPKLLARPTYDAGAVEDSHGRAVCQMPSGAAPRALRELRERARARREDGARAGALQGFSCAASSTMSPSPSRGGCSRSCTAIRIR